MSYRYETQYTSPNYTESNDGREYIVIHWWGDPNQNPSYSGVISTLCNPARQASAHYVATGTNRSVACLVSPDDTAWHAGDWYANTHSIGIECDPRCRDEDYDVVAELIANIRSAYGDLPLRRHSDFSPTQCPGNYDLGRLDAIARSKDGSGDWGVVTNIGVPANPNATVEQVKQVYREVLEREADQDGINHYVNYPIEFVRDDLLKSNEYEQLQANKIKPVEPPVIVEPPVVIPPVIKPPVVDNTTAETVKENNKILKSIQAIVTFIKELLTKIFK